MTERSRRVDQLAQSVSVKTFNGIPLELDIEALTYVHGYADAYYNRGKHPNAKRPETYEMGWQDGLGDRETDG